MYLCKHDLLVLVQIQTASNGASLLKYQTAGKHHDNIITNPVDFLNRIGYNIIVMLTQVSITIIL